MIVTYLAAFAAALVTTLAATPLARAVALRFGIVDQPSDRKVHTDPVPYLGGLAIIVAFIVAVSAGAALTGVSGSYLKIAAILVGGLLLAAMGLWDDLKVVPGWIKVPLELALGAVLYATGVRARLFHSTPLDLITTMAWVIGVTNAVNYLDNMDGLTAGVVAIASSYFAVMAGLSGQFLVASLSAALAGCALGFLWHNRPPARIFMGDAGSLFFGFLLAGLGLELRFANIARITFFVPVAVLAVPVMDALMVSLSRVRRGLSPIHPGKDHTSHRLVKVGIPSTAAVGIIYVAALACGWVGVVIAYSRPLTAYMLMGWMIAMGAFFAMLLLKVEV
ncbi:MAG: MraY family glycosyltransferase [Actinomycetota bacterium]|nr:undecaprenyl/decaprenyl-phosphate alpha-N-acetylglucosaminyl 1-phosphate transferase [Actinomycetota bacterium]